MCNFTQTFTALRVSENSSEMPGSKLDNFTEFGIDK